MDAVDAGAAVSGDHDRHPLILFISALFWVLLWLLSWVKAVVAFATITIPTWIYAILSYSMTLTLNIWSFAIIFALAAVALNFWLRFRYFNTYTKLKEPPILKADPHELHPDVNTPESAPAFHNYLDEFLQAVRVFGFLEKPVFHELARHLQTRRLVAGDSLYLDQDKSFYCVIDGNVQVFARTEDAAQQHDRQPTGEWDDEDMNGYQLLNQVGPGGTLSSLFTILSLFTEDVKISWQDSQQQPEDEFMSATSTSPLPQQVRTRARRSNSDVSNLDLSRPPRTGMTPAHLNGNTPGSVRSPASPMPATNGRVRSMSVSSSGSTVHATGATSPGVRSPQSDAFSAFGMSASEFAPLPQPYMTAASSTATAETESHYGVVARATEDSTLAVIPAEAFRRLTKKFPKSTAHIVQVILTRFSRVTFNAAHNHLGLTTEVLRTEKAINDIACHPLPASFYETGLRQLRQRFDGVAVASESDTESDYFSYSHPSPAASRASLPGGAAASAGSGQESRRGSESTSTSTYWSPVTPAKGLASRQQVQAGDLHTSTGATGESYRPLLRSGSTLRPRAAPTPAALHGGRRVSEDFDLREEVMSCIAKSIGLLQPPLSGEDSVEASPAFPPSERSRSTRGPWRSSFGSLSLLEMGDDASSMTDRSSTTADGHVGALDNEVEILFFPAGSVLAKAGERNTGMFYVIEGFLDLLLPVEKTADQSGVKPKTEHAGAPQARPAARPAKKQTGSSGVSFSTTATAAPKKDPSPRPLFSVRPGGIAGYLSSLCQTTSYVDIVAKTDTYVGFLPSHALERLLEKRPIVLLTLAKRLISLLSPLILQIDGSLDWMQVNAGHVLWRPDDPSDSFYIVINGRLRAIQEQDDGGLKILAEYGQGDTIGELDVITSTPRRNTVHAIRDTELIRMPRTLYNAISSRNPRTTAQLLRMIASRVRVEFDSAVKPSSDISRSNTNLKNVAILPVSRSVPVDEFARKLHSALESIGAPSLFLNQASVSDHLGRHAFTRMGKLKAAGWFAEQEQKYRIVLYVADATVNSAWTQSCIRQADCVMVVGLGDDPSGGEYERLLLSMKTTARKELVLLHPDRSVAPGSTREWLKSRSWVQQHIHVELPGLIASVPRAVHTPQDPAAVTALKNLKERVQSGIQKYRGASAHPRPQRAPHTSDFTRLARRICGKSIGLVLGGGGARGISHLGVIRALEEFGIPIDHIAGTSIGSFVGGLYAREGDIISTAGRTKQFSARMSNIWRMLSDVTYPIVAYTTGHEFNRSIYKAFYDLHIEDMWLPYFCNSTNINTSRMEIHETGYAWRFIRASMTLVGLLPPLCDNGNMLVDGGYIDNLPVSTMMAMGASEVIASDVGSIDDNSPRNFGDSVSGWWLFVNRWNPFSNARNIPAITEIQSRLAYVSSVKTLEEAKVTPGCLYMQMPVQEIGTLQFSRFEEIQKKGYDAAMDFLEKWDEEGRLPSAYITGSKSSGTSKTRGKSARRNSI